MIQQKKKMNRSLGREVKVGRRKSEEARREDRLGGKNVDEKRERKKTGRKESR